MSEFVYFVTPGAETVLEETTRLAEESGLAERYSQSLIEHIEWLEGELTTPEPAPVMIASAREASVALKAEAPFIVRLERSGIALRVILGKVAMGHELRQSDVEIGLSYNRHGHREPTGLFNDRDIELAIARERAQTAAGIRLVSS